MEMIKNHEPRYRLTPNGIDWLRDIVQCNIYGEITEPHEWVPCSRREINLRRNRLRCCVTCPGYLQVASKPGSAAKTRVVCVGRGNYSPNNVDCSELLVEEY